MNREANDLATALFLAGAMIVAGWFLLRADELVDVGVPHRSPVAIVSPSPLASSESPGPSSSASPGSPGPSASPATTPTAGPTATPGRMEQSVAAEAGFVAAVKTNWAEAAAIQTMQNILAKTKDATRSTQTRLQARAARLTPDGEPTVGAMGPTGWAAALTDLGYPYQLKTAGSRAQALKLAATAIRATRRPVGLVVRGGAGAWVMTGYRATDDPGSGRSFSVTSVRIMDPWYPKAISPWGRTWKPGTWHGDVSIRRTITAYQVTGVSYPALEGKYLVIVPVAGGA